MIEYHTETHGLTAGMLDGGFFEGWPKFPNPEVHLKLLRGSDYAAIAIDSESRKVVGFATAITDGVLSAYIPFLEVLPAWRKQGIATELVCMLRSSLSAYYMIDLVCDRSLESFYSGMGFRPLSAMVLRNYENQAGKLDDR